MTIESLSMQASSVAPLEDEPAPLVPEIICGELRTGRILATLDPSRARWSVVYNDAGTIEATIPLRAMALKDAETGRRDTPQLVGYLDPARCYLAVRVGDRIIEAGPIWWHQWDDDQGTLTVQAAGLWSLFDHRKVVKVLAAGENPSTSVLAWSALSLGTIAKRLVETAMSHVGGSLPLILPGDLAGVDDDDHQRTYPGYELTNMGEALRQLTAVANGPDIRFTPRLAEDRLHIEWVMTVGTDAQPQLYQSGQDWRWDLSVPRGDLSGLSVTRDAERLGYRAWVPGNGMAESMPLAMREDLTPTDAGWPLLEVDDRDHSTVKKLSTLGRHAESLRAISLRPWMTWAWQAMVGDGEFRPGDWAAVNVASDHPYLSALGISGLHRARILGLTGDLSSVVDINTAPTMEVR